MGCRLCGADISGRCFNCGRDAPRCKHYCDKCVQVQREVWARRPAHGDMASASPEAWKNAERFFGDARMILDDRVPDAQRLCEKCSRKQIAFE